MEGSFYIIIMFLIFLKLMIWVCVFYARARRRQLIHQRGLIIIQGEQITGRDVDRIISREHFPEVFNGGLDNPIMSAYPPSYEEVQHTKSMEEKPPSYEQVLGGNYMSQNHGGFTPQGTAYLGTNGNPVVPPQYSERENSTTNQS